ncbi:Piso0_000126 [Millerozyma farinosa CBS 7064]|uniref:Piso0_000126 protein n=1 Tax=Pichia sorbitophila (strain ATCC MYA-4447 / BCRC 22081 / CBS 7064 / NBRC 10061 / NRRL Y-12695) TaxID=559304 RepID=G8YT56_PICSO|nr:Piso0_000126 [Millerozyma farinosa CBS 7064]
MKMADKSSFRNISNPLYWSSINGEKANSALTAEPVTKQTTDIASGSTIHIDREPNNTASDGQQNVAPSTGANDDERAGNKAAEVDAVSTSWWTWRNSGTNANTLKENRDTTQEGEAGPSYWETSYKNIGSMFSSLYAPYETHDGDDTQNEAAPLVPTMSARNASNSTSGSGEPGQAGLWGFVSNGLTSTFSSWMWNTNTVEEEADSGTDDPELFKAARAAIEGSKDFVHYAFKSHLREEFPNEVELAVSNTKTELRPVVYTAKRKPIIPNEVKENNLPRQIDNEIVITPKTSRALSSGTVKSNESYASRHQYGTEYLAPYTNETFRIITTITRLRLVAEHVLYQKNSSERHIYRLPDTKVHKRRKKIKKVVVIGIHSFLPTKFVKAIIGHPTGNASTFTDEASRAVKTWLEQNSDSDDHDFDIQTIALEGEGLISERVENSYRLLENWIETLNQCDFLFVASHSQASVIAIHLLAKLLTEHHQLHLSRKRIGILCMAGAFMGPSLSSCSKVVIRAYTAAENKIINELFEFQKPQSASSLRLVESLKVLVHYDVKITLAGSPTDQWIPLYSSFMVNAHHPNIYRCFYIEKQSRLPPFVAALIKIALILKNLGLSDHYILLSLSEKCLLSPQKGGHCKIFEDHSVYAEAIRHSLETTSEHRHTGLQISKVSIPSASLPQNVYLLPWNVRGLINDLLTLKNLPTHDLVKCLLNDFQDWNPSSRRWKDLKYSLGALQQADLQDIFV